MAMEKLSTIKDTHNKSITAVSYNPMKHEIVIGFEGIFVMVMIASLLYCLFRSFVVLMPLTNEVFSGRSPKMVLSVCQTQSITSRLQYESI